MKNQESTQSSFSTMNSLQITQLKETNSGFCQFYKPAIYACGQKKCNKNAFMCQDQTCKCKELHQDCIPVLLKTVVKRCESKKASKKSWENYINQKFQQMIDKLSDFRDKVIKRIKQDFQFFGLNSIQKKFSRLIKKGSHSKKKGSQSQFLTGSQVWQIISSQKQRQWMKKVVNQNLSAIQRIFSYSKSPIHKLQQRIWLELDDLKKKQDFLFKQQIVKQQEQKNLITLTKLPKEFNKSKIMTSFIEFKYLEYLFYPKTIAKAILRYQGSDQNFEIEKFHQSYKGFNSILILAETEFDKKIGGYASIFQDTYLNCVIPEQQFQYKNVIKQNINSKQKQSFLLSLANGDKFKLKEGFPAIQLDQKWGPIFGPNDFMIDNKSDINKNCCAEVNNAYINEKYQHDNVNSRKAFGGNTQKCFKLKQWQAWALEFH